MEYLTNTNARLKLFMTSSELSRVSRQFEIQFDIKLGKITEHQGLGPSAVKRKRVEIYKIKVTIPSRDNSFAIGGNALHNLVTHACVRVEHIPHILNIADTDQTL